MKVVVERVNDTKSLRDHLRLRYDTYSERNHLPKSVNFDGLDVDDYDFFSRHLSLKSDEQTIATVRMVRSDSRTILTDQLVEIVRGTTSDYFQALRDFLHSGKPVEKLPLYNQAKFPSFLSFSGFEEYVRERCRGLQEVVECSRNVVHKDYRNNRHVGSLAFLALCAESREVGIKYVIGSCSTEIVGFYTKLGAEQVHGLGVNPFYLNDVESAALILDLERLDGKSGEIVEKLRRERTLEL